MGRLLESLFGLRPEERTRALLMAGYHVLLLLSLYLLKPVRDSLFLSDRGAAELPFVFILTTAVVVPVALLHTRAGARLALGPLIEGGSLFLVLSIVGLRGLLAFNGPWTAYVLYAWVSIYGLLVTSQFWLFANALFTSSQSKRVFTVLSAGAIVGAILGGEATSLLVNVAGLASRNLLWLAGGVLLLATGLARFIRLRARRRGSVAAQTSPETDEAADQTALSVIGSSRHIQLIVSLIALMVIVTTFVDYQFKTVAARAYASTAGLTSFMGQFYGGVSLVALLVQFFAAPRLMRVVGIGGALSVLPGMLALGSVGMLLVPGLAAGIFLRGAGQSLKHSVDKTGRELLFVPVPLPKKKRVKVFVDVFVDQGAQGLGGVLLLFLAASLGLSMQALSAVTLALIAGWGLLAYRARQSYIDQFRAQLRAQEPVAEGPAEPDPPTVDDALLSSLCSHAETKALRALETMETDTDTAVPIDVLQCLFDHPSAAVRAQALRVLRVRRVDGVGEAVAEMLRDRDPDVQLEAARYLYCQQSDQRTERLRQGLQHDDPQIQAAMVGLIATEGDPEDYELVSESLLRRLVTQDGDTAPQTRTQVARLLGVLDRSYRIPLLHHLLQDASVSVQRAAVRAAGKTGDRSFLHPLIERLGRDATEAAARQALASFGPPILGTLYDYLVDSAVDLETRRRIPPIFVEHPGPFAVAALVRGLKKTPVPLRHAITRALSKLHQTAEASPNAETLDAAIRNEARHHAALGQLLRTPIAPDGPSLHEDLRALREESLERIFRLLGLRYDQRDLHDAYLGITSSDPALRDSAVEFVDNLINYDTRRYLLPLLDDPEGEQAATVGAEEFNLRIRTPQAARQHLRTADDPRLSALLDGASIPILSPASDGAPDGAPTSVDAVLPAAPDPEKP